MKEFRLSATVPASDEIFAQAETLAAIKPAVERFAEELRKIEGAEVQWELVTPRPREAKPAPLLDVKAA